MSQRRRDTRVLLTIYITLHYTRTHTCEQPCTIPNGSPVNPNYKTGYNIGRNDPHSITKYASFQYTKVYQTTPTPSLTKPLTTVKLSPTNQTRAFLKPHPKESHRDETKQKPENKKSERENRTQIQTQTNLSKVSTFFYSV